MIPTFHNNHGEIINCAFSMLNASRCLVITSRSPSSHWFLI
jgi:hypothetical protein